METNPRAAWLSRLHRIASAPLEALATGRLRATMPVGAVPGHERERAAFTHLEALARSLLGLAPWLELRSPPDSESKEQARWRELARTALATGLDPRSPDAFDFRAGPQALVEAAFLACAALHAPTELFQNLDPATRARFLDALRASRVHTPYFNNWLLFSAMVETALLRFAGEGDLLRIDYALRQHEQWYKGDGAYGDGPEFHWDYYNSYVIQPFLLLVLDAAAAHDTRWDEMRAKVRARALRYAAVLERLVAPDGTFPPLGRSLTYRCGAFHHLALMALREDLPPALAPGAARSVLSAVIARTLDAPGTFSAEGWLQPGLCGHQPELREGYISTGSLYLCTAAFLPLGLPATAPFWSQAALPGSSRRIWDGENLPADHALK